MTKFILIIWVCSFASNPAACLPPIQHPKPFNSWYECSRAAHHEAGQMMSDMGFKYVNENKIAMSYTCRQVSTI